MKKLENKFNPLTEEQKMTIQLLLGCILALFGITMLIAAFFCPPIAIIDASILTAVGEVFTFSGSLIGIDYSYKYKTFKVQHTNAEDC